MRGWKLLSSSWPSFGERHRGASDHAGLLISPVFSLHSVLCFWNPHAILPLLGQYIHDERASHKGLSVDGEYQLGDVHGNMASDVNDNGDTSIEESEENVSGDIQFNEAKKGQYQRSHCSSCLTHRSQGQRITSSVAHVATSPL